MCAGLGLGPRTPPDPPRCLFTPAQQKNCQAHTQKRLEPAGPEGAGRPRQRRRPSVRMAVGPQNRRKAGGRMAEPSTPKQQGTPQMCEALNCTSHSSCS